MYNPISDSESWRKQVDAYFRVMRYIAEQGYPEHALLIWNEHARHATIPSAMETLWQCGLRIRACKATSGDEKSLPDLTALAQEVEIVELQYTHIQGGQNDK